MARHLSSKARVTPTRSRFSVGQRGSANHDRLRPARARSPSTGEKLIRRLSPVHPPPRTLGQVQTRAKGSCMTNKVQMIPVVGLLGTVAVAGYMVAQLSGQPAAPAGDYTNASVAEVRDA